MDRREKNAKKKRVTEVISCSQKEVSEVKYAFENWWINLSKNALFSSRTHSLQNIFENHGNEYFPDINELSLIIEQIEGYKMFGYNAGSKKHDKYRIINKSNEDYLLNTMSDDQVGIPNRKHRAFCQNKVDSATRVNRICLDKTGKVKTEYPIASTNRIGLDIPKSVFSREVESIAEGSVIYINPAKPVLNAKMVDAIVSDGIKVVFPKTQIKNIANEYVEAKKETIMFKLNENLTSKFEYLLSEELEKITESDYIENQNNTLDRVIECTIEALHELNPSLEIMNTLSEVENIEEVKIYEGAASKIERIDNDNDLMSERLGYEKEFEYENGNNEKIVDMIECQVEVFQESEIV